MNSLLWKTWRENRGYFVIFTAWMILALLYTLVYEYQFPFRATIGAFSGKAQFYTNIAAIILALRVSLGERIDRSLGFTVALPISVRQLAVVRLLGGVLVLAIPLILTASLLSLLLATGWIQQAEPRFEGAEYLSFTQRPLATLPVALEQLWSVTAIAILGGVQLLFILSLLGTRFKNQMQLGLLGAVTATGQLFLSGTLWTWRPGNLAQTICGMALPSSLVIHWGYGELGGGTYMDHELAELRWISLVGAIPLLYLLGKMFAERYGIVEGQAPSAVKYRWTDWLPQVLPQLSWTWKSRATSLIWLELRQALPLVVLGGGIILTISISNLLLEGNFQSSIFKELPHTTLFIGLLWGVVMGSGLYTADLSGGQGAFWRSRPISPSGWFWGKFGLGLIAILVVLDGSAIALTWNLPRPEFGYQGMSWAYVACTPLQHALIYTLAVLGTCWFRKPIMGGVVAILGYSVCIMLLGLFPATATLDPVSVYNFLLAEERRGSLDFTQHGFPLVYGTMLVMTVLFAWLSSRLSRPWEPNRWQIGWSRNISE